MWSICKWDGPGEIGHNNTLIREHSCWGFRITLCPSPFQTCHCLLNIWCLIPVLLSPATHSKGANLTFIHSEISSTNFRICFVVVNGSNISSVIWLCSFVFLLLPLLLSWWYREFRNEFLTGVVLLRNKQKVGLSESLLGLELGLALNPKSLHSCLTVWT